MSKKTVVFICTGNSARSQIAQALLLFKASKLFDVYSAGTNPEAIDNRALTTLSKFGLPKNILTQLSSNSIDALAVPSFDYAITLCSQAEKQCRDFTQASQLLHWDFADPKKALNHTEKNKVQNTPLACPFDHAFLAINERISMFIQIAHAEHSSYEQPLALEQLSTKPHAKSHNGTFELAPTELFKCLTDDIRLKAMLLTTYYGELCVCELMVALGEESQPKISRNLAILKKAKLLITRKHGQWIFYRLNPLLPLWVTQMISQIAQHNIALIVPATQLLSAMSERPSRVTFCKD